VQTSRGDEESDSRGIWAVDLFLRGQAEPADENHYLRETRVFAANADEALSRGMVFGKRLIDGDMPELTRRYRREPVLELSMLEQLDVG
jgi:hypothetical protein